MSTPVFSVPMSFESSPAIERPGCYAETAADAAHRRLGVLSLQEKLSLRRCVVDPHVHRHFEQLIVIKRGGGTMMLEDGQYTFHSPSILIVPSYAMHGFAFEANTERWVVTMAKDYLQEVMTRAREFSEIFAAGSCIEYLENEREYVELEHVIAKLAWEQGRSDRCREIVTEALIIDLLVSILRKVQQSKVHCAAPNSSYMEIHRRFLNMLEEHLGENWSLQKFAHALRLSPSRLRVACRSVSGESPLRIINTRIILEVKRCLTYTSLSVSEIAYRLGFDDPSYFSRFFKSFCGRTPTQYRAEKTGVRWALERQWTNQ